MLENYKNLTLNEKRNELNNEVLKLLFLVNKIVDENKIDYYNYDINNPNITEDDFLCEEYAQIKEISDKLISVFK